MIPSPKGVAGTVLNDHLSLETDRDQTVSSDLMHLQEREVKALDLVDAIETGLHSNLAMMRETPPEIVQGEILDLLTPEVLLIRITVDVMKRHPGSIHGTVPKARFVSVRNETLALPLQAAARNQYQDQKAASRDCARKNLDMQANQDFLSDVNQAVNLLPTDVVMVGS